MNRRSLLLGALLAPLAPLLRRPRAESPYSIPIFLDEDSLPTYHGVPLAYVSDLDDVRTYGTGKDRANWHRFKRIYDRKWGRHTN